jgi:type II secretory pathway component PulC
MRGFRFTTGTEFAALRASGLRQTDVLTAVNGIPVQDYAAAQRLINDMQSGHAAITVIRGGRPIELNLNSSD